MGQDDQIWELDDSDQLLLQTALESFDRMRQAQALIRAEGITVISKRSGVSHVHPAIRIETDSRSSLLRAWKALGLDIEAPGFTGRPAGKR